MDDDQQFCLRWNNHQSTLVAVFDTLLENGTLVDCTLAAEGKYLNAHKVVLSACSPYFETLLSQNYDKHPIFILKDVKFQELKAMMDYMYRGEVNISQDQLGALLKAAESLQIKGLSDNKRGETTETTSRKREPPQREAPPQAKTPPPAPPTLPKVQGLTIEHRRQQKLELDDSSRDGSMSPGPRRKKRARRRSEEMENNHDHASNSSESHHSSTPASHQNIPSSIIPLKSLASQSDVPESLETKSEIISRHKQSLDSAESSSIPAQVPIIKEKLETHSELMLEPKSEYVDEMNEDSIEDLTLDDDDISNMEHIDDSGAGPSHGNMEGGAQGFGWPMGNQSQDEVFLAAQEAVGAHRDSQENLFQEVTENLRNYHEISGQPFECGSKRKKQPIEKRAWMKLREFETIMEAQNYMNDHETWKKCGKRRTLHGNKTYYRCSLGQYRKMECPTRLYLLYHSSSSKVSIYSNCADHDNHIKNSTHELDNDLKVFVSKLFDRGIEKPSCVIDAIRKETLLEPPKSQLIRYLHDLNVMKYGPTTIPGDDLDKSDEHIYIMPEVDMPSYIDCKCYNDMPIKDLC